MWFRLIVCVSVAVSTAGCGTGTTPASSATSSKAESAPRAADTGAARQTSQEEEAPGAFPAGLHPDAVCAEPPAPEPSASSAAAPPLIPLIEGLTLSQTWIPRAGDYEHECLVQITKVDSRQIWTTRSCPVSASRHIQVDRRQICRTDFADATLFAPGTSEATPDVMGGTTFFTLSQASFRELARTGETAHRLVHVKAGELRMNLAGTLKRGAPAVYRVIVNDRAVDLPVVGLTGALGPEHDIHPHASVLADERFPLLLDYGWDDYSVRFTKISFPAAATLEAGLEQQRRVDVYGIYFDFGSDRLRAESEPVLREIAAVLVKNPGWTLAINGHTDNIGGDAFNLTLSQRRSEAVRAALAERYAIDPARLTTSGFGASQPKASNDTIEGRARNRRVELVRQ